MAVTGKIRVGILGASGYTGADLVRILVGHPEVEIALLTADRKAGLPIDAVFPHLGREALPGLISLNDVEWHGVDLDVVFCALPHATSQDIIKGLFHKTGHTIIDEVLADHPEDRIAEIPGDVKVVDLSADFRLRDTATYAAWYGHEHLAPDLQKKAVYGLTEHYRDEIAGADLVACPGCYPTAVLLALIPLLEGRHILTEDLIIDAKSGVSGAGRSLREQNLFTEVSEAMHPYGVGHHRHMPEIEQELGRAADAPVTVSFTPHLVPMNRGELVTIYVKHGPGNDTASLKAALKGAYDGETFVHVLDDATLPATRHVRGSNHCIMNVFDDRISGRSIVIAAIDNLVKGSSGQAVQNMNLMMGLNETTGLTQAPLFP